LAFLWCLVLGAWCFSAPAGQKNSLLIIADNVGADASSLYNSTNTGPRIGSGSAGEAG
jgi:hypothetical protein